MVKIQQKLDDITVTEASLMKRSDKFEESTTVRNTI